MPVPLDRPTLPRGTGKAPAGYSRTSPPLRGQPKMKRPSPCPPNGVDRTAESEESAGLRGSRESLPPHVGRTHPREIRLVSPRIWIDGSPRSRAMSSPGARAGPRRPTCPPSQGSRDPRRRTAAQRPAAACRRTDRGRRGGRPGGGPESGMDPSGFGRGRSWPPLGSWGGPSSKGLPPVPRGRGLGRLAAPRPGPLAPLPLGDDQPGPPRPRPEPRGSAGRRGRAARRSWSRRPGSTPAGPTASGWS